MFILLAPNFAVAQSEWLAPPITVKADGIPNIPASLGALEGGYVAVFSALGLGGALGLSYTLIRRLREVLWALVGVLWLPPGRARRWIDEASEFEEERRNAG